MPQSLDSGLVGTIIADAALVQFAQALAPMTNFWMNATPNPIAPLQTIAVPVGTGGSVTLTDENANFEQGDSTLGKVLVTPHQITQPFRIDNLDLQKGFSLEQLAGINAKVFAKSLWDVVTALMVNNAAAALGFPVANSVVQTVATLTPTTLGKVYGLLVGTGPKYMLISTAGMGALLYTTPAGIFPIAGTAGGIKAMGFESINEQTTWAGAQANSYGFGYLKDAIVIAAGTPAAPPVAGQLLDQRNIPMTDTGLTAQFNLWYSTKSRAVWGSYDIIFGAARGVITSGCTLVTA